MAAPLPPQAILERLHQGQVIPAHPLALDKHRKLDERRQRGLTRYYLDAGAGGIAVAVHTTQFEIRKPQIGMLRPVLELASEEIEAYVAETQRPIIKIAGVVGDSKQAQGEAELAAKLGYHAALLSLSALATASNRDLIQHCKRISDIIPLVGFYLQQAVGGRPLDVEFWRDFVTIENVIAIKIAPFNRYQTFDVVRGAVESGRGEAVALYTGNDDNIVVDLLTEFAIPTDFGVVRKRLVGGLLGQWAVWTRTAVKMLDDIHRAVQSHDDIPQKLLTLGTEVTDCNAAFFDVAHNFSGCIVGIHEVLRRQGLLGGTWTLDPSAKLSPAQSREIDRVYAAYPHLNDDEFVTQNIDRWLR